ncbi:MAG: glycosyltransferase family 2 protein [Eggerthellaceae bacterium]|nr:glycosyltransferase family 2 protein [Eggerthellaceae bacterium]
MPLFSIVIPVYNAEQYLGECLDSVMAQTYPGFEAICVNDGSADSSGEILREYADGDPRFRIVSRENGGPSAARNTGLRCAKGKYVVFLDCDDALEPRALEQLEDAFATYDVDATVFGWSCIGGNADRWLSNRSTVPEKLYPSFEPALAFDEPTQPFLRIAVKHKLLSEREIAFDETLYLGEDAAFLLSVYPNAEGVKLLSDRLYRYRLPHDGSIMQRVSGSAAEECLQAINTVISVYGRWKHDNVINLYRAPLVEWTVKYALYTALRQEEPVRSELCSIIRELWLACFDEQTLRNLDIPAHAKRLVNRTLDCNFANPSRDLLAYRISEYGLHDLALTALDRMR